MAKTKDVPANLKDHPEYRKAYEHLVTLEQHRAELETSAAEIEKLAGPDIGTDDYEIETEALAMLGSNEAKRRAESREQLNELRRGIKITMRAIELQKDAVEEVRKVACAEVCDALTPEWHSQKLKVADLASQLADALDEQSEFCRSMVKRGFTHTNAFLFEQEVYNGSNYMWKPPRQTDGLREFSKRIRERVEEQDERLARRSKSQA